MEEKQKFVCSYCGAEYDDAPARARCELECDEKQKQKMERERQELLRAEKETRKKAVVDQYNKFVEEWKQYQRDYHESIKFRINGFDRGLFDSLLSEFMS